MKSPKSVCVFCGARNGRSSLYAEAARELGVALARQGYRLVFGGGHVGLMGITADAVLAEGGEVIGVIPRTLQERELAHQQLTDLRVVETMHERKALMEQLSDIVVALPGGFGTLDELNEILTWKQLGFHHKPIFLLNINGYYTDFVKFIANAVSEGFIAPEHRQFLIVCESVQELEQALLKQRQD